MKAFLDLQQNTNNHHNDSRDCSLLVFRLCLVKTYVGTINVDNIVLG